MRTHPVRTLRALAALAVTLVSIGCGSPPSAHHRAVSSTCEGSGCTDAGPATTACGDGGCTSTCTGAGCSPPPRTEPYVCAPGVTCQPWQSCLEGICIGDPPTTTCTTDAECASGEICASGLCFVPPSGGPLPCAADADCGPGAICEGQLCLVTTGTPVCTADADCGAGLACEAGLCVSLCTSDADCVPGESCVGGVCHETTPCTADTDCTGGEVCVAGTCTASGGGGGGGCFQWEHCH